MAAQVSANRDALGEAKSGCVGGTGTRAFLYVKAAALGHLIELESDPAQPQKATSFRVQPSPYPRHPDWNSNFELRHLPLVAADPAVGEKDLVYPPLGSHLG